MKILETERLILRYQEAADIAFLVDLWSDPVATRYLGGPRERDWLAQVFAETAANPQAEPYDLWPVVDKSSGHLVGHCGLLDKDIDGRVEIELNYMFYPTAWGQGYAVEIGRALLAHAFQNLGLKQLVALIEPANTASIRVAEKLGMRRAREIIRPGGAKRLLFVLTAAAAQAAGRAQTPPAR
ncbi:MAG TPA: GNAT family N-acetyltransferase [Anaerolineaceae bacterium]|jgi:RimJ/RimL family protein N-acetyltransferase|nr:GNAT family N-acetyltransferase [Anaerolineaceae bacterium]